MAEKSDTPLMRQYHALKAAHPHAILFFHLGDFFEMFGEDAKTAAPILGLVLTARQGIPMCGIPVHAASGHVAKLLKAGHKVAIAEQASEPTPGKGLVKREVFRLITPGTVVEDELLDSKSTNYLAALELDLVGWGLACIDVSTGEFWATQTLNDGASRQLLSLLARVEPAELLARKETLAKLRLARLSPAIALTETAHDGRRPQLEWTAAPDWRNRHLAVKAAVSALAYVEQTRTGRATLVPSYRETHDDLQLDETAVRTLELIASGTGERKHSLLGMLDRCRTSMGSRRLRQWILHPLTELKAIHWRQNCVQEFVEKVGARRALAERLAQVSDVERIASRLSLRAPSPRDLGALRASLAELDALRGWFSETTFLSGLAEVRERLEDLGRALEPARTLLEKALVEQPPLKINDGGIFRDGFDADLDELRSIRTDSRKFISELEARERAETGIPVKIGYTSVFGYYLDVTKPHLSKVPARYHRKQTVANGERFITPELKELESKLLGAEEKMLRLETRLFERLREEMLRYQEPLAKLAAVLSELDVLAALAETAEIHGYVKPRVDLSFDLMIENGRHPVVEQALPAGGFVPNAIQINSSDPQILILTGPNMGGKSTYLRQNALIVIMAQLGGFVPADSATIGIVDKILTRIGAQDALARNESTFMVEMRETAHILQAATPRSLVILDEVGRGTSTYDGISIAWSVLEHLHTRPGPRTLFATHYFELTELADLLPGVRNINVEAREWTNADGRTEVVFLHKISPGPADRSFGIHVAQLAGLPQTCITRAREILSGLEQKSKKPRQPSLPLFEVEN